LSGKEFQEDGAATANTRLARYLCVLGTYWSTEVTKVT